MDDNQEPEGQGRRRRQAARGVRIIGAEEAAAALETGEASGRRPLEEPRYGDVPRPPEGPRPVHRFPLPESVDPTTALGAHDDTSALERGVGSRADPRGAGTPAGAPEQERQDVPEKSSGAAAGRRGSRRAGRYRREVYAEEPEASHSQAPYDVYADEPEEPYVDQPGATGATGATGQEPYAGGPEPAAEWPQDTTVERGRVELPEMQHWTEPATGEVPQVLVGQEDEQEDDMAAWASLPSRRASWRDEFDDWEQADYEPSMLADDETRVGALDEARHDRPDLFTFDLLDPDEPAEAGHIPEDAPAPSRAASPRVRRSSLPKRPTSRRTQRNERESAAAPRKRSRQGGRNLRVALLTGIGFGVLAAILFKLGPVTSLLMAAVILTLAAAELYAVLRRAGYQPATLLGLAATASLIVANYLKGETAVPLVLALTAVFGLLWYLVGVVRARPLVNFGVTMGGFLWVGLLGSFAGLLLNTKLFPDRHGVAFLLGAVLATIAYDVGGYALGQLGHRPLAPSISPKKTWEGLVGGMAAAFLVSVVIVARIHPWSFGSAAALGIVVAVVAPIGDLCESMVKRDLGTKDMGTTLPGHGGILDRVDAMIFVLPATYYLVRLLHVG